MSNTYFQFKQFTIHQGRCAMKVTTDGCLFGAWVAEIIKSEKLISNTCLDIGTGTGLLSLMTAQKNNGRIDALEIEKESAEQAAANAAASPWSERINVMQADVRNVVLPGNYDLIISNPPFYENELKGDDIKKNTAHHDAGLLLPKLLPLIRQNLAPEGSFFLLLPYKRETEIKALLAQNEMAITKLSLVKQTVAHGFFRLMIHGRLTAEKQEDTAISEISIKDEKRQYTPAFIHLLKDYYLHL